MHIQLIVEKKVLHANLKRGTLSEKTFKKKTLFYSLNLMPIK
jgi:hypothetical protein